MYLNSVASQCAAGKSSIARKPEEHIRKNKNKKKNKKCNPPAFKFFPNKLIDKTVPHMV